MEKKEKREHAYLSSVIAIVVGLLVGYVILLISNPSQSLEGFIQIVTGALTHGTKGVGQIFYYATPIIMTGLSIGFAFKTGLFNIGTPGQFIVGAFGGIYVGIKFSGIGSTHWILALLAAILFGAVWALIPGILKAFCNVNEVISCIMMNYIGMYLVNYLIKNDAALYNNLKNESNPVANAAQIPKMGLDKLFPGSYVGGGIIIAFVFVILIYIILNKTTFGYELKAVGYNKDASKYAGINEKRSVIVSMLIAGALAGLGGGLLYLSGSGKYIEIVDVLAVEGFTGISVALLGLNNPIGIFFAAIFIAYITQGGFYLQLLSFSPEIINIIIAVIIYFSAFALILKNLMQRRKKSKRIEEIKAEAKQNENELHIGKPSENLNQENQGGKE